MYAYMISKVSKTAGFSRRFLTAANSTPNHPLKWVELFMVVIWQAKTLLFFFMAVFGMPAKSVLLNQKPTENTGFLKLKKMLVGMLKIKGC